MHEIFVPGRLCLLGEHSDWAAGHRATHPEIAPGACLVAGTNQGFRAIVRRHDREVVFTTRVTGDATPRRWACPVAGGALAAAAAQPGFFRYAAGVAAEVVERFAAGGIDLEVTAADLPVRKGLSSSAAICVLVARAFSRAWHLDLTAYDEMDLAYCGERRTGSECGRMDQVCAFGRAPSLMTFDGDDVAVERIRPGSPIPLLIVDMQRAKDTRRILADLNACFPAAPGERAAAVRRGLGARNAELVGDARRAVELGDAAQLGSTMREAQISFDTLVAPACTELRAPRLHEILALPWLAELTFGGKGVGSQGDGCAQFVARDPEARAAAARRLEAEEGCACLPLDLDPARAAGPDTLLPGGSLH